MRKKQQMLPYQKWHPGSPCCLSTSQLHLQCGCGRINEVMRWLNIRSITLYIYDGVLHSSGIDIDHISVRVNEWNGFKWNTTLEWFSLGLLIDRVIVGSRIYVWFGIFLGLRPTICPQNKDRKIRPQECYSVKQEVRQLASFNERDDLKKI